MSIFTFNLASTLASIFTSNFRIDLPDFGPFEPPREPAHPVSLRDSKLQVIVKLANIHLTPTAPSYEASTESIK